MVSVSLSKFRFPPTLITKLIMACFNAVSISVLFRSSNLLQFTAKLIKSLICFLSIFKSYLLDLAFTFDDAAQRLKTRTDLLTLSHSLTLKQQKLIVFSSDECQLSHVSSSSSAEVPIDFALSASRHRASCHFPFKSRRDSSALISKHGMPRCPL